MLKRFLRKYHHLYQKRPYRISPSYYLELLTFKNRHKGEECVVVATGPSVNEVDISLISKHPHILGTNGAYLLPVKFQYFFVSSLIFFESYGEKICTLDVEKVFLSSIIHYQDNPKVLHLILDEASAFSGKKMKYFTSNPLFRLSWGPTVLIDLVLPMALWMGFQRILLIGTDYPLGEYKHFYDHEDGSKLPLRVHLDEDFFDHEMALAHHGFNVFKKYLDRNYPKVEIVNCSPLSDINLFEKQSLESALRT